MADLGFSPPNGAAPEKAVILPMRSAGMRYVAVIASSLEKKDTEFAPAQSVVVKVGSPGASRESCHRPDVKVDRTETSASIW